MKTLMFLLCLVTLSLRAEESRHRVFGLSDPGRELDLREQLKAVPEVELTALDLETAEATFRYDVPNLLPDAKNPPTAEVITKRLDELVKKASKNPVSGHVTFSLKPLSAVPKDQLQKIEIQLGLLDCKGCRYKSESRDKDFIAWLDIYCSKRQFNRIGPVVYSYRKSSSFIFGKRYFKLLHFGAKN